MASGAVRVRSGEGPEAIEGRFELAAKLQRVEALARSKTRWTRAPVRCLVTSFSTGWKKFTCRRASCSEFINQTLYGYCTRERLPQTGCSSTQLVEGQHRVTAAVHELGRIGNRDF